MARALPAARRQAPSSPSTAPRRTYVGPAGGTWASPSRRASTWAPAFGTPILATADGIVAFTGAWSIRGNVVVVDHGAGVHSVYGHASRFAVATGDRVTRGQTIAYIGSTGLSTGPHLHWEMRVGGSRRRAPGVGRSAPTWRSPDLPLLLHPSPPRLIRRTCRPRRRRRTPPRAHKRRTSSARRRGTGALRRRGRGVVRLWRRAPVARPVCGVRSSRRCLPARGASFSGRSARPAD